MNKKTLRNSIVLVLVAVVLVVTTVFATAAYLRSSAVVTNSFTVGNVAISMDEQKLDENGNLVGSERVIANKYLLQPGLTYIKDPTIHVQKESENLYLFAVVANGIKEAEAETTMENQMLANGWKEYANTTTGKVYVYAKGAVENNSTVITKSNSVQDIPLFAQFTIKANADLKDYETKTVIINAYAIQAAGLGIEGSPEATKNAWDAAVSAFNLTVITNS